MLRATKILDHVHGTAGRITLDETGRNRRRMVMVSDAIDGAPGIEFLLDLPETTLLRHGEGLLLDDGRVIEVIAAPEALYAVFGANPRHLLTLAWQIGNRHLAAEIHGNRILIRQDAVIKTMLEGLGARVMEVMAPFTPEGGAYGGRANPHDHGHGSADDHHGHDHGHKHG
ncbi:MAG: urease accessory protein UreE [Phyllobacteriaceae bacterium]|nr:urease accessory protein UreE [Phyllobacteriaceae bacterium]